MRRSPVAGPVPEAQQVPGPVDATVIEAPSEDPAPAIPSPVRQVESPSRGKWILVVMASAAVILGAVIFFAFWNRPDTPPARPQTSDPRPGPVPPPTSPSAEPGHDPVGARDAPSTSQSGCEAIIRAGREALQAKDYDRAITTADTPLAALGLCPGAQRLKQEAIDAKTEARRRELRQ